jgi:hypothetical protein
VGAILVDFCFLEGWGWQVVSSEGGAMVIVFEGHHLCLPSRYSVLPFCCCLIKGWFNGIVAEACLNAFLGEHCRRGVGGYGTGFGSLAMFFIC